MSNYSKGAGDCPPPRKLTYDMQLGRLFSFWNGPLPFLGDMIISLGGVDPNSTIYMLPIHFCGIFALNPSQQPRPNFPTDAFVNTIFPSQFLSQRCVVNGWSAHLFLGNLQGSHDITGQANLDISLGTLNIRSQIKLKKKIWPPPHPQENTHLKDESCLHFFCCLF